VGVGRWRIGPIRPIPRTFDSCEYWMGEKCGVTVDVDVRAAVNETLDGRPIAA
jgi:hypothetical protein